MEAKIFDQNTKTWVACLGDATTFELKEVFGRWVPVEFRASLIACKSMLGREVDLEDLRQMRMKG